MSITFPSGTSDIITQIRNAVGRLITFNRVISQSGCSACSIDPVTNVSTNSFCSECGGKYWIDVISGTNINAHVRWRSENQDKRYPGGYLYDGDCTAQIEYTDTNMTIIDETNIVVVDNRELSIKEINPKGVPELNRIIIVLEEEGR